MDCIWQHFKIGDRRDPDPEFERGDTAADIQRGERREGQEKGKKRHRNRGRSRPGGRKHTQQRREYKKSMQGQTKFNICATDISTATAASTSCKGIHFNHPRDSDVSYPVHLKRSAEPSGNQRTAAVIHRAASKSLTTNRLDLQDHLPSHCP